MILEIWLPTPAQSRILSNIEEVSLFESWLKIKKRLPGELLHAISRVKAGQDPAKAGTENYM